MKTTKPSTPRRRASVAARRERGVASLIVVMVLFFIVALVAAYTNRSLIFEQRTSANQYRATQATEAAQAGIEWAVTMLNSGIVDAVCNPGTPGTDDSFRQRYLSIDTASGAITPKPDASSPLTPQPALVSSCQYDGTTWSCSCPKSGKPTLTPPTGPGVFPAFAVRMVRPTIPEPPPGVVRIEVVACPRWSDPSDSNNCLSFANTAGAEGRSIMSVAVSLQGGLKAVPVAALTAQDRILSPVHAYNTDPNTGITVQSGQSLDSSIASASTFVGPPGTPGDATRMDGDETLKNLAALPPVLPTVQDRMFSLIFGLTPAVYLSQPALYKLPCSSCTAADVRTALANNPLRPLWIDGDLALDSAGDIGSAAVPALLVVSHNITASANVNVYGFVYSRNGNWGSSGSPTFTGAAFAETDFSGTGTPTFAYDAAVLATIRRSFGSFAVVPSTWRDF